MDTKKSQPIVAILELHGVSLIKLAGLVEGRHAVPIADLLAGLTIATEELLAVRKVLNDPAVQHSPAERLLSEAVASLTVDQVQRIGAVLNENQRAAFMELFKKYRKPDPDHSHRGD